MLTVLYISVAIFHMTTELAKIDFHYKLITLYRIHMKL